MTALEEVYRQQAERTQDHLRESINARVAFISTFAHVIEVLLRKQK